MDVVVWLRSLGLEQYEAAFRENGVDETVLPKLTPEDVKDLGVTAVGHRRKLLEAIAELRSAKTEPTPSEASSPAPAAQSKDTAAETPPSHGDVLRLGRLNGAVSPHGP